MPEELSRRRFHLLAASTAAVAVTGVAMSADPQPEEAKFTRDYEPPKFKPAWKKPQINRLMLQDFVIAAHSDLDLVKKLLGKEPMLINGFMDWGGGDWESGLGGATHMNRKDIVLYLLEQGARIDIFTATMLGMVDVVKTFLTLQPKLIEARGPHGFSLHFHAQLAGDKAPELLDYLQSIKKVELKPNPFVGQPKTDKPKTDKPKTDKPKTEKPE